MADRVERILEYDLSSVDNLQRLSLISSSEQRAIIARRRQLEYKIHRRNPLRSDFLQAIEFETNLYALIEQRLAKTDLDASVPVAVILAQIRKREYALYRRMVDKFNDYRLWCAFLDYARRIGSNRALSLALTRAMQLHSSRAGIWLRAMSWEFDVNEDVDAARIIMQRALRMLPTSREIWLGFFRMEIQYIRQRRAVIGQVAADSAIPKLLFEKAIDAIPDDWKFRAKFLDSLRDADVPDLCDAVVSTLASCDDAECIDYLATFHDSPAPFVDAVARCTSLWPSYVSWVERHRPAQLAAVVQSCPVRDESVFMALNTYSQTRLPEALEALPKSSKLHLLRARLMLRRFALSLESLSDVLDCHRVAVTSFPGDLSLWLQYLRCIVMVPEVFEESIAIALHQLNWTKSDLLRFKMIAVSMWNAASITVTDCAAFARNVLQEPTDPALWCNVISSPQLVTVVPELVENGLRRFGRVSPRLWQTVAMRITDVKAAQHLIWRARSTVDHPEQLDLLLLESPTLKFL